MKPARLPFSYLLPLAELLVWVLLVSIPATLTYFQLHLMEQSHTAIVHDHFFAFAISIGLTGCSHFITALNLPGLIGEVLIDIPKTWPFSWRPSRFTLEGWRALVFPFYCLPAWWFVGRGLDAFFGRRRLHRATVLAGSALSLLCLVLFTGLCFTISADERGDGSWILWGFSFWTLAFAIFPAAWIRQRKSLNQTPEDSEQPTAAEHP